MRRIAVILLALIIATVAVLRTDIQNDRGAALAQDNSQVYHNDALGLTFEYPANWVIREQMTTRTVLAASKSDMDAIAKGNAPAGLLFTVTFSSFRLVGVAHVEDFGAILQRIALAPKSTPLPVRIGGAQGLSLEVTDSDVAARTAILSIGSRRLAILRGVATASAWEAGAADQLNKLIASISFTLPANDDLDSFGRVSWQLPVDKLAGMAALTVSPDDASIFVADTNSGIWQVSANGTLGAAVKPDGIGTFTDIGIFGDGRQFVADPKTNTIWQIASGQATRFIGGKVGADHGSFGPTSPRLFAFGPKGLFYVLDESAKGTIIQVFNRVGDWGANWSLKDAQPTPIQQPLISSDDQGNVYLVGSNTNGVIKLDSKGALDKNQIGKDQLADMVPTALMVDPSENIYVATSEGGILKLDKTGKLVGVIGDPYDESAPPKPGQLGKPSALALDSGGKVLYVADSGKYPQIVAFALNGNDVQNLASGTTDQGQINYGQTLSGEISASTFVNTYEFQGKARDVLTITMRVADGSALDPYIDLIGPNKVRLAFNDDVNAVGFGSKDAQISGLHLPFDGTYIIRATRFGRETTTDTGKYTLTLATGAPAAPTFTPVPTQYITTTPRPPTATLTPVPPTITRTPTLTPTVAPWRATSRALASSTVAARQPPASPTPVQATTRAPTLKATAGATASPTGTSLPPSATLSPVAPTATNTTAPTATLTPTLAPTLPPSASPTLIPPVVKPETEF